MLTPVAQVSGVLSALTSKLQPRLDLRRHAPMLGLLVLYAYLGYHALSGSQGLAHWMAQGDRAVVLQGELDALQARRAALQGEVDRLSSGALDLDSLDIEARRVLFVAKPGEQTIWLDP